MTMRGVRHGGRVGGAGLEQMGIGAGLGDERRDRHASAADLRGHIAPDVLTRHDLDPRPGGGALRRAATGDESHDHDGGQAQRGDRRDAPRDASERRAPRAWRAGEDARRRTMETAGHGMP